MTPEHARCPDGTAGQFHSIQTGVHRLQGCSSVLLRLAEFLGVMARDIRSYDSEQDIRNAWKVRSWSNSV